jgi:restriction endonuclease S subunit
MWVKDCTVWIPELAEQKRISKLLRSLDCKIELNRVINQNLPILVHSSEEEVNGLVA